MDLSAIWWLEKTFLFPLPIHFQKRSTFQNENPLSDKKNVLADFLQNEEPPTWRPWDRKGSNQQVTEMFFLTTR